MEGAKKIYKIKRPDLLYPELSFIINGVLIDVSKVLGGGHLEKYYQKAVAAGLEKRNISFQEQVCVPLMYEGKIVGKYFLDFVIDKTIIVELKRGQFIPVSAITQTKQYLSALHLKLAIIAYFTHGGVILKRIINEY